MKSIDVTVMSKEKVVTFQEKINRGDKRGELVASFFQKKNRDDTLICRPG